MAEDWQQGEFGLYVHWPFCESKCPYCDFNSHVVRERVDHARWAAAFSREIARLGAETPGRVLNSIFFGGGTPSLMQPDTVAAVIEAARDHWVFANDIEITLEANPGSVEAGRFAGYRDAGVNRISLGVQALDDEALRRLGRLHTVAEARAALDIARRQFERVSFDLIYARQGQDLAAWRKELTEALAMAADHLSLYQLTIEPGTAFGQRFARGQLRGLPDEDLSADMYQLTQELCAAQGLPRYEVSNHAREGAESRHNLIYWRYGDYAGIGPGAHGRLTVNGARQATECHSSPGLWLAAAENGRGEIPRHPIPAEEQATEYLMMCLRLTEPLDVDRFNAMSSLRLNPRNRRILAESGMIRDEQRKISVSDSGVLVLNAIIAELLAD
ncbi:radical SAM family heme chaperone HemW [Pontibaca methylaminivorans]|uniref:radical SAM family heme chaperone HemW n=1 Tax=Pontibaca methylaminivorans TaxID=515897 RepID=UPI002FD96E3D